MCDCAGEVSQESPDTNSGGDTGEAAGAPPTTRGHSGATLKSLQPHQGAEGHHLLRERDSPSLLVRMLTGSALLEDDKAIFSKKLEIALPFDPAIPLL